MPSIQLTIAPAALEGAAGAAAVAQLTLTNRGDTVAQYQLSVDGIDAAWARLDPNQVGIFPRDQATAQLVITAPPGAPPATYRVIVLATNQISTQDEAQALLQFTVRAGAARPATVPPPAPDAGVHAPVTPAPAPPAPAAANTSFSPAARATAPGGIPLELAADLARVTMLPGGKQTVQLAIRNASGTTLDLELTERGLPDSWVTLDPRLFVLGPNQAVGAICALASTPDAPPGDYPLNLVVQDRSNPAVRVRLDLTLEIGEAGGLVVEVLPPQAEGQAAAEVQVRVSTGSPAAVQVRLAASDNQGALDYAFDPPTLFVPASGTAAGRLRLRARRALSGVDSFTVPFTVEAVPTQGGAAPSRAEARFVQRRTPPLGVTLSPPEQRSADQGAYRVRLTNPAQVPAELRLSGYDPEGGLRYQFNPPTLTLPPSGEGQAVVAVVPLQPLDAPGGRVWTFTVRAEPASGLVAPGQAEARLIQMPAVRPTLALNPPRQSSSGYADYALQIANTRDAALEVTFAASDPNGFLQFAFTPAQLRVAPRGQGTARLRVQPTAPLNQGEDRRLCEFTVEAQARDLPDPVTVSGSLTQLPGSNAGRLVPWLILGVMVLLLCLAAAVFGAPFLQDVLSPAPARTPTFIIPRTPTRSAAEHERTRIAGAPLTADALRVTNTPLPPATVTSQSGTQPALPSGAPVAPE